MNSEKTKTALLVMDMQSVILAGLADQERVLENIQQCIAKAKESKVLVIYVVLGFRDGFPEVSATNARFSAFKERLSGINASEIAQIHPAIKPEPDDIIVTKRRVSAFAGSDLEMILRANNINHLLLCGVATSGVVLSTFTEAADKDYKLTVLADACKDRDEELHQTLVNHFFAKKASVVITQDWIQNH